MGIGVTAEHEEPREAKGSGAPERDSGEATGNHFKARAPNVGNSHLSKQNSKEASPVHDFKKWKTRTLERFIFHLKQIRESKLHQFTSPKC